MAGAAIAAAAYQNTRKVAVESHPLEGSLNKRMQAFNNLAGKAGKNAARPDRYAAMGDNGIAVV
eukprot:CAMPEP_0185738930 /NCGR_PEP_ID=MMETSP1171-20130828/34191_1 /TAXON_ID=374046 /ORGANISM="Helicotheca tamensis, Strain CCMP826" /LENGTH=63 /DNA_ID=CAMNT_0028410327 /DNA_START=116 /DNA_END=307 /DNA_ORIENTATION=+